ncbi:MAG TPA: GNAT family N-acetyltransferase [Paludibacter sp.]
MKLEYLSWDSDFFSKKIGRINCQIKNESELLSLLAKAKEEGYQLIYVFGNADLYFDQFFMDKNHAKLVDRKVLYTKSILSTNENTNTVQEYKDFVTTDELESLAYLSGAFSRFRLDNKFETEDFYRLYKTWITKSVSKDMADKVFVVREHDKVVGMVTLKIQQEVGEIGLIAVSESAQSKGYGKDLINTCINAIVSKGIHQIEVPTQMENIDACCFYEKCGFKIKSITNIYHFWL